MAGVLAKEFAYTADECASLVHTYGRTVTRVLTRGQIGDRFTIVAKGPKTGLTVGLREWEWSPELRDYKRAGEYLCGWREAVKALYLQTGELFTQCRFEARATRLPVFSDLLNGIPVQRVSRVAEAA